MEHTPYRRFLDYIFFALVPFALILVILLATIKSTVNNRFVFLPEREANRITLINNAQLLRYVDRSIILYRNNNALLTTGICKSSNASVLDIKKFEMNVSMNTIDLKTNEFGESNFIWFVQDLSITPTLHIKDMVNLSRPELVQKILSSAVSNVIWDDALLISPNNGRKYIVFYRNNSSASYGINIVMQVAVPYPPMAYTQNSLIDLKKMAIVERSGSGKIWSVTGNERIVDMPGTVVVKAKPAVNGNTIEVHYSASEIAMLYVLPLGAWLAALFLVVFLIKRTHVNAKRLYMNGLRLIFSPTNDTSTAPFLPVGTEMGAKTRVFRSLRNASHFRQQVDLLRIQLLNERMMHHLLLNFLSAVKMSALIGKDSILADAVNAVGIFVRESLDNDNLVPISKEIILVEQYLNIINYIRGKRFSLLVDTEQPLLQVKILRFLLQPVVENCVQHGLKDSEEGIVKIHFKSSERLYYLTITDSGCGMSERAAKLLQAGRLESNEGGYAIRNLLNRLKLFYGQQAAIKVHSLPGKGTSVCVIFPE